MRTIWKFPIPTATTTDAVTLEMPKGAQVVRFASQAGVPTIWALVDDQAALEDRPFQTFGTGHPVTDGAQYVGSYEQGPFVWHVFDMGNAVAIPDAIAELPQEAVNAYMLLRREGFMAGQPYRMPGAVTKHDVRWAWVAPSPDPLTTEQMMAVAELQEHGFGAVVKA